MKILILAGGSGTRLWPLSRLNHPKQFLKLFGGKSLLQNTAERFRGIVRPEDFIVITNRAYEFDVRSDLPWLEHIILEPVGRNTAPAIALAAQYAIEKLGCGADEVIFVSPSDHLIEPVDRFVEYVGLSQEIARAGHLVTFGIKPVTPETGYGYIKAATGRPVDAGRGKAFGVEAFVEKPDLATAQRYLAEGHYCWNSGMFAFTVGAIKEELSAYASEVAAAFDLGYEKMMDSFETMPSISIDYAVMEKSERVAVIPAELNWNDVGSWDSVFDMAPDNQGAAAGNVIAIDSDNTVVLGDSRLIAAIGLTDCIIVDTPDALLVVKKGYGQKVKKVVDHLIDAGRREASEHVTTRRPWGSFTNLLEAERCKVKRIIVNPGGKLSLQYHGHRSEHWVVVKGRAKVTIGGKDDFIGENGSAYIPATVPHRMENCEAIPLEIIEVQYGDYLGEDDIARIEDVYGRISTREHGESL
jgi:mannose-1-phosphate guanylyltransferase/mannose-6-phosphate isomerase